MEIQKVSAEQRYKKQQRENNNKTQTNTIETNIGPKYIFLFCVKQLCYQACLRKHIFILNNLI